MNENMNTVFWVSGFSFLICIACGVVEAELGSFCLCCNYNGFSDLFLYQDNLDSFKFLLHINKSIKEVLLPECFDLFDSIQEIVSFLSPCEY